MPPCASIDNRQIGRNQHTTASDTLAGRAASLTGEIAGKKLSRYLEIEPTLGDTDDKIDLRLFIEDKTHSDEAFALNTAITLQNEFPLEFSAAGRKTKKVTVSVQRLEIAH